jgi:hypothetical protein
MILVNYGECCVSAAKVNVECGGCCACSAGISTVSGWCCGKTDRLSAELTLIETALSVVDELVLLELLSNAESIVLALLDCILNLLSVALAL